MHYYAGMYYITYCTALVADFASFIYKKNIRMLISGLVEGKGQFTGHCGRCARGWATLLETVKLISWQSSKSGMDTIQICLKYRKVDALGVSINLVNICKYGDFLQCSFFWRVNVSL